ncbi:MAG: hypothetical protein HZB51_21485 [Chloroflexi bacterium]|nr:hypothetical protein [Chloroflexota bacterium]
MLKRHFFVLAIYAILAMGLTYPLVLQISDHIPGSVIWGLDEYTFLWNFWWFKHALFDLGVNPLQSDYIFYPIGVNLVLYTFMLLNSALAIPIEFIFGYPAAINTLLLFAFVLSGYGTFLLVRYLLRDATIDKPHVRDLAAFVAGAVFAFTSSRFVYVSLGHYNFVSSQFIPFFILFFIKSLREPHSKNAILAGVFGAFAVLIDVTYAVFLAMFGALYLPFAWRNKEIARGVFNRLLTMAAVAFGLASPLLIPSLFELITASYTLPGWGHAEKLLNDLVGLFTPTTLHPLNRNWFQELDVVRQGISQFADVNTVFLGYATLVLAIFGALVFRKKLTVWIVSAISFVVLSMGPLLHINGQSVFDFQGLQATFPLPFLLLHYIPFLKENRAPNRFGILVILSLAVLIGFGITWLYQKIKFAKVSLLLTFTFLLLILFEHLALPLPMSDTRVPEVYAKIAQDPGDFAILSLPIGWRNSFGVLGVEDTRTQFYQSVHGKRLLGGNTSRNAAFLFDYFDRIPLLDSLRQVEFNQELSEETIARDQAMAPQFAAFFDIRYIVVNAAIPNRVPYSDSRSAVVNYIQNVFPLGEKIYDRDGVLAYRLQQAPLSDNLEIDFGTDRAHIFQAEGWDRDEPLGGESANWVNQTTARVLLPIRQIADYEMTLRALPFAPVGLPIQSMRVYMNGQIVDQFSLDHGWKDYTIMIPAKTVRSGLNNLTFRFDHAYRPRDVTPANFVIANTGVTSPVDIVVNSGAFGSIKVNGVEASLLGRGYNIVVIDPKNGKIISAKSFNTADDKAQSRAMTDFIAKIPNGFIVVVSAQESAGLNLGDRTVAGLKGLGSKIDLRQNPNRAHALVGVKGATPGTADEESKDGSAFVVIGHSADERTLAAAISAVMIEKK